MADQQGTGKHGHKDSQEPWPHTKENEGKGGEHRASEHRGGEHSGSQDKSHGGQHQGSESADLKRREYRDEKGEVHHHTKTYMEDHGKK
jgi:hypothetical protein